MRTVGSECVFGSVAESAPTAAPGAEFSCTLMAMTGFRKEGGLLTSSTLIVTFAEADSELPAPVLVACTMSE